MPIFNFVVLSVITAPHNGPTPQITKTHLPIVSLLTYVNSNWIGAQKTSQEKRESPCPLRGGGSPIAPPEKPKSLMIY